MRESSSAARRPRVLLAGLLASAGVLHFVRPQLFGSMVPEALPHQHELVLVSGAVEIAAAGLLMVPATQRLGGATATALLIGVWPANVQMTVDAVRQNRPWWHVGALIARLPLQVPLVRIALRAARAR
ncbi:MAG: hypothetical protein WB508_08325 [Aeromicrobium sp.]|uniref:DoxX family protein n=1 Tax=Aeromicrobium sp. TaxID=1871063 RepID=UPI003C351C93